MILITGITGKTGGGLIDAMIENGYKETIRVVVRETSNLSKLKNSGLSYEVCYGDISDELFLSRVAEGCETVCHIASKSHIDIIAKAVTNTRSVKHCYFVSSTSIYSEYRAASDKLIAAEKKMKLLFQNNTRRIAYTIIRPTMIFGTTNDKNISTFMKWLDRYPVFPIVNNGEALLQPVEKRDLGEGVFQLLSHPNEVKNKEYIISGDRPITLKYCLRCISDSIGKKTILINIPMPLAKAAVYAVYGLSMKKIDYLEKLARLTENRNFEHKEMTEQFGYTPQSFEFWIQDLAKEYLDNKKG